jgi:dephospho-CoA kinase
VLSVALTGGIGTGKSEVLRVWGQAGVPVISADELSRRAVDPGSEGLADVRRAFGDDVVAPDGRLDRVRMRDRIFQDEGARRRLEDLLHPRIGALREQWIVARAAEGHPLVVSEIPLLYEARLQSAFEVVVVVDAPVDQRLRRLTRTRGLSEPEARRIMAAQMDPAEKRRRADYLIENDGTLEQLEVRALAVLEKLQAKAGGGARASDGMSPDSMSQGAMSPAMQERPGPSERGGASEGRGGSGVRGAAGARTGAGQSRKNCAQGASD